MCNIESSISIIFCTVNLILVKGRMSVLKTIFRAVKNRIHCKMGFLMEANMLPNSSSASQKGRPIVIPFGRVTDGAIQAICLSHCNLLRILSPERLKMKISINLHKWGMCPTKFKHLNLVVLFIHCCPKSF